MTSRPVMDAGPAQLRWDYSTAPLGSEWEGLPPLFARLLHNRGVARPADADAFLAADERLSAEPFLLPDMDRAVARILRALLRGECICVYGDFDADGITATVVLSEALREMGARVVQYIPHRVDEGHGLNDPALDLLHRQGVSLVVSVDCGITAVGEIRRAAGLGLDVIVTDHHQPIELPPALAAVNPKRDDSRYPWRELAGVGVAFKLVQALFHSTGRSQRCDRYLDLVALGTVADVVPLLGENRYLVKRGLEVLQHTERPGMQRIIGNSGLDPARLDSESISFYLAPRLNAAGRLDHAQLSYEVLVTQSVERAERLASLVEDKNKERQRITQEVLERALEKLAPLDGAPLLMVGDEGYPAGVVGVVAGKLVDRFYRPAVVMEVGQESTHGSCRSIPEFNIMSALTECRHLLSRYGGHAQAAGFTALTANIEALRQGLLQVAERELVGVDLRRALLVDAEVPLSSLSGEVYAFAQRLAPFGHGNPAPAFLSRRVQVLDSRVVGSNGGHVKLKLRDGDVVWDAIGFDLGGRPVPACIDVVYNVGVEGWGGRDFLKLYVLDFIPAQ